MNASVARALPRGMGAVLVRIPCCGQAPMVDHAVLSCAVVGVECAETSAGARMSTPASKPTRRLVVSAKGRGFGGASRSHTQTIDELLTRGTSCCIRAAARKSERDQR